MATSETHSSTARVAIIGAGGMGRTHAGSLAGLGERAQIVAVADPSAEAAKALADSHSAGSFESAEDLFSAHSDGLDALVICTPPSARENIVKAALDRGIAVLVEKPLAENVEHAERLASLAESHAGVVTACGYCHRFTPAIRDMMSRVESGDIGRLVRFENVFACSIPDMGTRWMSEIPVSGGGSLIDTGCHSLDLFQYMAGGLEPVASVFDRKWQGRGESGATSLVKEPKTGIAGVIKNGWIEPARFLVTLVGEEGILMYDYEKPEVIDRVSVTGERATFACESHEVRFDRQMEAFVSAALGQERDPNLATFKDGLNVARAVATLTTSAS